jgi:hypothetical protein
MNRSKYLLILFLFVMMITACSPQAAAVPTQPVVNTPVVGESSPTPGTVPAAIEAARKDLADQLQIPLTEVQVVDYQQAEWSDGCLGLGGPAELCLAAITPGYAVKLEAGGEEYSYRTDMEGKAVRQEVVQ